MNGISGFRRDEVVYMFRYTAHMTLATKFFLIIIAIFVATTLINLFITLNRFEALVFKSQLKVHTTLLDGISCHLSSLEKDGQPLSDEVRDNALKAWITNSIASRIMVVLDDSGNLLMGNGDSEVFTLLPSANQGELNYTASTGTRYWFVYQKFPQWDVTVGFRIPYEHRIERVKYLRHNLLPTIIVIPLFSLLIFSLVIFRIVLPLKRLTAASIAVAGGDLDYPISIRQSDEIGLLAKSFNEMRHAVEDRISELAEENKQRQLAEAKLKNLNESLEKIVEERTGELKASISDLETTQRQLIESEKSASLSTLIVGIAHEFNTPLGIGITGLSSIRNELESCLDNPEASIDDYRKSIVHALEMEKLSMTSLVRIGDLIKSLRLISLEEADDILCQINLLKYTRESVEIFRTRLEDANCTLDIGGDESVSITTYPGILLQVLSRLIDNTLVHGFHNWGEGKISIEVEQKGKETAFLRFRDNGTGMDAQVCKRIFEPFYTTDRGRGRPGLGLYIVYNLVDKYLKGRIECCSAAEKGSSFSITIPNQKLSTAKGIRPYSGVSVLP